MFKNMTIFLKSSTGVFLRIKIWFYVFSICTFQIDALLISKDYVNTVSKKLWSHQASLYTFILKIILFTYNHYENWSRKKNPCVGRQYDIKFNDIDFVDTPRPPINIWKIRETSSKQVRAVAFFVKFGRMRLNAISGRYPNALAT